MINADTMPVRFEVLGMEPVHGRGRLLGLASVLLDMDGLEVTLQGVSVVQGAGRPPDGACAD